MATDREGKRSLPGNVIALLTREAARMPLVAVGLGLKAWEQGRPARDLLLRRGSELLQIAAHTPLGRFLPQPTIDDGADVEAEQIATDARIETAKAPATPHLAIADFDNVSIGSLRARLRSLSPEDLVTLRDWEKSHANRLAVVTLLDNRIAKVSAS